MKYRKRRMGLSICRCPYCKVEIYFWSVLGFYIHKWICERRYDEYLWMYESSILEPYRRGHSARLPDLDDYDEQALAIANRQVIRSTDRLVGWKK